MTMTSRVVFFRLDTRSIPSARRLLETGQPVNFVTVAPDAVEAAERLVKAGARQISEKDQLDNGTYHQGRFNVIAAVRRATARWAIGPALARLGGSPLYVGLAERILIPSLEAEAFMAPYLAALAKESGPLVIDSASPRGAFGPAVDLPEVSFTRRGHGLERARRFGSRLLSALVVLVFPLLNAAFLWRKGVRPGLKAQPSSVPRPLLFVHREPDLRGPYSRYRDMYFIHHGLLDPRDCHHMPMATSQVFSAAKRTRLTEAGGIITECRDLRPSWSRFLTLVIGRPLLVMPTLAMGVLACPIWRWRSTLDLMETLHFISLAPMVLDHAGAKAVLIETEVSPMAQVMAVETRRRGGKAVSMIHGAAGQHTYGVTRMEMQFSHLITNGHWHDPLHETSPAIQNYLACGNIEIDHLERSGACLPQWVRERRDQVKVVAFLARLNHVLTTDKSIVTGTTFVDPSHQDAVNERELGPLFRWVAETPDVVLVWKTTLSGFAESAKLDSDGQWQIIWKPWMQPLIAAIPPERFAYLGDTLLEDLVAVCDLALCNDGSSAFACVMSAGRPAISIDYIFGGIMRRYHPRLAAVNGPEIVENAKWLLANPLPDAAYRAFNLDFYGMEVPDFKADAHIKAALDKVIAEPGLSSP